VVDNCCRRDDEIKERTFPVDGDGGRLLSAKDPPLKVTVYVPVEMGMA
jgi:hypothetical protein